MAGSEGRRLSPYDIASADYERGIQYPLKHCAANADDVFGKDINPASVPIGGTIPVIDSNGQWIGDPTGLIGPGGTPGSNRTTRATSTASGSGASFTIVTSGWSGPDLI